MKGWRVVQGESLGAYRTFEQEDVLVVCAGIGARAALKAVDKILALHKPSLLISGGFAGSLVPEWTVGQVISPATVIKASTGVRFFTRQGCGTLVSVSGVADPEAKRLLARRYNAHAVDMEAAVVADAAAARAIPFLAVKAISDEIDFPLPEMDSFVDAHGRLLTRKFLCHIALRPKLWPIMSKLGSNSRFASQQLCAELRTVIENEERQSSASRFPVASVMERETGAR